MIKSLLIFIIKVYQKFSRYGMPHCRFYPSCSQYAVEALENFGAVKGTYLSVRRLLKCHPFHSGGYDPVKKSTNSREV